MLAAGDSMAFGRALLAALAAEPLLLLAGQAAQAGQAVELARSLAPDLVVIDLQLARKGGFAATAEIMEKAPAPVVLLASEGKSPSSELRARAMLAGARLVLSKPAHGHAGDLKAWGRHFADAVWPVAAASFVGATARKRLELFALVASAGGPAALAILLDGFDKEPGPLPILVAQHMARGFSQGLCNWLKATTGLGVEIASEGARTLPGHVYLAPEGRDLEIGMNGLLRTPDPELSFWPSGNRLLRSLARHFGPRCGGAVLTGMGHDGAQGLLGLAKAGGVTMVQEKASCTVSGMPEAALELFGAHPVLGLHDIKAVIREASRATFATQPS
jgi:two-component system chemotaxis response regulator CheB